MDSKIAIQHNKHTFGNVWHLQWRDTRTTYKYSTLHSQHYNVEWKIICRTARYINKWILICKCTRHTTLLHEFIAVSENCERYNHKKEIFDLNERHDSTDLITNKNFFSKNYIVDIFVFITALITLLVTTLAIYPLCKHKKLRMLVVSPALQQVKEVGTVTQKEINTKCKILIYISLTLTIFSLVMVAVLHYRKSKLCRRCMFSNAVKIMIIISDVQYYVPIKLCKTAGSIHLFKITDMLKQENVKLNWIYIWDTIEIDWTEVNMTFNSNKVTLPRSVTIKLGDKFKIRHIMRKDPLLFHIMLKQGITWFTLASNPQRLYKTI